LGGAPSTLEEIRMKMTSKSGAVLAAAAASSSGLSVDASDSASSSGPVERRPSVTQQQHATPSHATAAAHQAQQEQLGGAHAVQVDASELVDVE